ncbi:MAG TPA: hypothetical protein PKM04_08360, partial [Accumulibacter sp.]|nr:hypothetical protein [Accumulibacter sp.]
QRAHLGQMNVGDPLLEHSWNKLPILFAHDCDLPTPSVKTDNYSTRSFAETGAAGRCRIA